MPGHGRRDLLRAAGAAGAGLLGGLAGCSALSQGDDPPSYLQWLPTPQVYLERAPEWSDTSLAEIPTERLVERGEYSFVRTDVSRLRALDDRFEADVSSVLERSVSLVDQYPLFDTVSPIDATTTGLFRPDRRPSPGGNAEFLYVYHGTYDPETRTRHLRNVRYDIVGEHRGYRIAQKTLYTGEVVTVGAGADAVVALVVSARDDGDDERTRRRGRDALSTVVDVRRGERPGVADEYDGTTTLTDEVGSGASVAGRLGGQSSSWGGAEDVRGSGQRLSFDDSTDTATVEIAVLPGEQTNVDELVEWVRDGDDPAGYLESRQVSRSGGTVVVEGTVGTENVVLRPGPTVTVDDG